ncbi:hypothetical protein [Catellatospora vulcania]|uniref:hypothetical protein n=1 Tax=Catellatospora vulcania TaxID=1460450 RepID=UPI0012D463AD|nr:hypothetical protein [Catellatospora vulcania]
MADPLAPVDDSSTGASASVPPTEPTDPAPPAEPGTAAVITLDRDGSVPAIDAPARPRRMPVLIAAAVAVVLLLGVGAYAVYRFAFADGRKAEEFTPASVVAFASIDLEVGLEQQLKLLKLGAKTPQSTGGDTEEQRDKAMGDLLHRLGLDGVDVDRDLLSWLGRRVAVSFWLDGEDGYALITASSTDSGDAEAGLGRVRAGLKDASLGFVVRDGVALIAVGAKNGQQAAEKAFAEAERAPLATAASFSADRAWLQGDQLAVIWADLARYGDAVTSMIQVGMTAEEKEMMGLTSAETSPAEQGRFIAGVRATDHGVEARYRTFGAKATPSGLRDAVARLGALPADTHVGVVAQLPRDLSASAGALGSPYGLLMAMAMGGMTSGIGDEVDLDALDEPVPTGVVDTPVIPESPELTPAEEAELDALLDKGFDKLTPAERKRVEKLLGLPADAMGDIGDGPLGGAGPFAALPALDGAVLSVAVRTKAQQDPAVRIVAEALDAAAAGKLVEMLSGMGSSGLTATAEGTVVTATSSGYTAGSGTLAGQTAFQHAVADAPAGTDVAVYVNLAELLPPAERAKTPFQALVLLQGVDNGDQTGVLRLVMS